MGVCAATSAANTTSSQGPLAVNDFLRGKMKVLKKFKKKMGLAPRSGSSGGTNNLPPILFHQVHGDNIRVSRGGTVARRAESFCKGVTFSSRPIKVAEKVCVKFLEVSDNWSGVIRFGFTCNDPNNLRYGLPKYACPDLTNKPGYWAKALAERFAERDTVLFYYVTQAGDVYFGINGEEKGLFFSGVETRGPLWAIIDVYGNSTAIELVDPRLQLNNSRRRRSGARAVPARRRRRNRARRQPAARALQLPQPAEPAQPDDAGGRGRRRWRGRGPCSDAPAAAAAASRALPRARPSAPRTAAVLLRHSALHLQPHLH